MALSALGAHDPSLLYPSKAREVNDQRLVVIGASAGGVATLEAVVRTLAPDFSAPILIVLHVAATQKPLLPGILSNAGPLRATAALDGEELRDGRIYVASADHHLMVDVNRLRVVRGPKENHFRPSIDVLFRSAAYHYGSRAIGVVLTGALSDGASGLFAIRRLGGIAVVQDPQEAVYASMPLSAMRLVDIDYALPAAEIGPLLERLMEQAPRDEPLDAAHYRSELEFDLDVAAAGRDSVRRTMKNAQPSAYTCPECHGVLFRIKEGRADRFRCHTGHGFSTEALMDGLSESNEAALWHAVRTLQESTALLQEAAANIREAGDERAAEELSKQAAELEQRLALLRPIALTQSERNEESA